MISPITPLETKKLSATTFSSSVSLTVESDQVCIYNAGSTEVFVRITSGASTAVTTDYVIPPGAKEVISKVRKNLVCSAIYASGSGDVYFTAASGV